MTEAEALARARAILNVGQRLYNVQEHRTRGGTSYLHTYCIVIREYTDESGPYTKPVMQCLDFLIAPLLHLERSSQHNDAIVVGGFGLNLGLEIVQRLSTAVFGYAQALEQEWL